MSEKILVTDARLIVGLYGESDEFLLPAKEEDFLSAVDNAHAFLPREEVENDPSKKQIIAYCVIEKGDSVFMTKRLKKQTEKRLHDRHSIGVGGHINTTDVIEGVNVVKEGLLRELNEEVFISPDFETEFLGIINDNSTSVNSVHAGACYKIKLKSGDCSVKETEKMEGFFVKKSELKDYYECLEGWSQIVFNSVYK
ncbi:MAG: NUDIX hydrolase [Clostridia bacterium]|nr:NUDIX hydrolase [Clostridia bacterium]